MNPILSYTLHVSVAFALFYLVYKLFLSTDTFFVRNRFYLLGAMLASLISPLLKFKIKVLVPAPDFSYVPSYAYSPTQSIPVPEVNYWHTAAQVALYIYAMGVTFYLIRLVWAYHKVIRLILKSERKKLQDLILVITRLSVSPFSLLKWLVIPSHHLDHPYFENIVQHESIHSRQYHSVDLFLAELLVAIQWFNPFAWWLKKSMVENHEFIVDQVILRNGMNPQQYQYSLLNFSTGRSQLAVVNYFNANLLKKRIRMMNKNKSPKWHGLKNLSILIIAVAVIGLTASFEKVAVAQNVKSSESKSQLALNENEHIVNKTVIQANSGKVQSSPNENDLQPQPLISSIDDLRKFMMEHLRYPQWAAANRFIGTVKTSFTIDKSGVISNISFGNNESGKTKLLEGIVVVGYPPQLTGNFKTDDVQVIGYANGKTTLDIVEGARQLSIPVEECLKIMPKCQEPLSGSRYTIPVSFAIQERPLTKIEKDSSHSIIIRNVNTNEEFLLNKNDNPTADLLYYLDGKKISQEEMKAINSSEILSISVMKDKSAVAVYGEEGKNGVILITTKTGLDKTMIHNLLISPIPATDNAQISLLGSNSINMLDIQIFDKNEKLVFSGKKSGPTFSLTTADIKDGIYKVLVDDDGKKYQGTLSVKH